MSTNALRSGGTQTAFDPPRDGGGRYTEYASTPASGTLTLDRQNEAAARDVGELVVQLRTSWLAPGRHVRIPAAWLTASGATSRAEPTR